MSWTDRQRPPANQGAGFEWLLGHGVPTMVTRSRLRISMRSSSAWVDFLTRNTPAWGVDPTLDEFDLVRREHSALCHQESVRDVAFVECDVGWDVGRLEHLEQVWCLETARHFRDDGVRQERGW